MGGTVSKATTPPPTWIPTHRAKSWERDNCNEKVSGYREKNYRGCQNKTTSGKTCQRWDATRPHSHSQMNTRWKINQMKSPGDKWHNYCRNPDNESGGIWCYTTDPNKRWEYCNPRTDIPEWQRQKKIDDLIKDGTPITGKNLKYYKTYGRYIYTNSAARKKCKDMGLELCPRDIMYKNGKAKVSVCSAGWVQYPDNRGYSMTYNAGWGCGGAPGWRSWSNNKSSRGSAHCCAGDKKRKADADAKAAAARAAAAAAAAAKRAAKAKAAALALKKKLAAEKAAREAAEKARLAREKAAREEKERLRLAAIEAERRRKAELERLRKLALEQENKRFRLNGMFEELKYIPDPKAPTSSISKKWPSRVKPGPQCTINGRVQDDLYPSLSFKVKTCKDGCKGKCTFNGSSYECTDPKIGFPYNTCTPGKTTGCALNAECIGKEGYECDDMCCRHGLNYTLDCDLSKKLFKWTKGISKAEYDKKVCTPYKTKYCARNPPCEKKSRWQAGKCG